MPTGITPQTTANPAGPIDPCGGYQPALFNTTFPGNILSPNFPQNYPSNKECSWIIETDKQKSIKLSFNHFELEESENCM